MIKHKDHFHGSDLEKIEDIFGIKKEDIVSFSANVNPLGISPLVEKTLAKNISAITTYPDREYKKLRESIATYTQTEPQNVIVGNGTTELITLFIEMISPKKAMILGPTYSEYQRSIAISGGVSFHYALKEENNFKLPLQDFLGRLTDDLDLLVLCNPNNPTSSCISQSDMRQILNACMEHGISVMVDETYMEFVENMEKYTSVTLTNDYTNIIVLRGTSKFFASPGLRLGYAITGNTEWLSSFQTQSNPWAINSLAALAGEVMFQDQEYMAETRALMKQEKEKFYNALANTEFYTPFPPSANFMLIKINSEEVTANDIFSHCIKKGLMIRDCSTFPFLDEHYIRLCFMSPKDNDALLKELLSFVPKKNEDVSL